MQKPARSSTTQRLPKEVLNPLNAMRKYRLDMPAPSAQLKAFVDHYWMLRWDRRGKHDYTCEVIPSPYINLTFSQVERGTTSECGAMVTGITTGKYCYQISGAGFIFGVKFLPGAFYSFWPHSLSQLTDKAVPAQSLLSRIDESVQRTILTMPRVKDQIACVEELLLGFKPQVHRNTALVNDIIRTVEGQQRPTVAWVAQRFAMSERYLQQVFRDHVGVGLKWIILRVRLQRATGFVVQRRSPDWADIALQLGYSDQSHFTNDFTRVIGMSPGRYLELVHRADEA